MSGKQATPLTKKDFASEQEIRWCPGCGDYAILSAVQSVFPKLGIRRENFVVVSGIGCSSRFPYYMKSYGFHTVHGRAPSFATGIKLARPELSVWVVTGDGDGLAIGGNHLMHAMRRNVDITILLFNNRIYGLTKGQYSPTSEKGKKTVSTPLGSLDRPYNPISLALGANATFVARSVDRFGPHLQQVIEAAARHRGASFVEIYQNCNIFNDGTFADLTDKSGRVDNVLYLEHGKPMRFGPDESKGIAIDHYGMPKVVDVADAGEDAILVHDLDRRTSALAFTLAQLDQPGYPVPVGIFRKVEAPTLDGEALEQTRSLQGREHPELGELLKGPSSWRVD